MKAARQISLALGAIMVGVAGCAALPPDPVTDANYALVTDGMTKAQVFALLGPGVQQSDSTVAGMHLETYVWSPRDNYSGGQALVTFKDGYEMSKVKVGF